MINKKDFILQTEKSIVNYSNENINEQSLIKALSNFDLYQKQFNTFFGYLKDWYSLHNNIKINDFNDNYSFVKYLSEENNYDSYLSKGLEKDDLDMIKKLSKTLVDFYSNTSKLENFINKNVKKEYPNLTNILGPILTMRFISQVGSLKRLSSLPASTIQLIGAENALFKHLKFGKKSPKYGLLYLHPIMSGLQAKQKGKLARYMADKISLASRIDYAKKTLDEKLLKDVEKRKDELLKQK